MSKAPAASTTSRRARMVLFTPCLVRTWTPRTRLASRSSKHSRYAQVSRNRCKLRRGCGPRGRIGCMYAVLALLRYPLYGS